MERRTIQEKPNKNKPLIITSKFDKNIINHKKIVEIDHTDDLVHELEFEQEQDQDNFTNYIITSSIRKFSSKLPSNTFTKAMILDNKQIAFL